MTYIKHIIDNIDTIIDNHNNIWCTGALLIFMSIISGSCTLVSLIMDQISRTLYSGIMTIMLITLASLMFIINKVENKSKR